MNRDDLIAYAEKKYGLHADHRWENFPAFSVITSPLNGEWLALVMNVRSIRVNRPPGQMVDCADIRCGELVRELSTRPGFVPPIRMRGGGWIGVILDEGTASDDICRAFDSAVQMAEQAVRSSQPVMTEAVYRDTQIPASPAIPSGQVPRPILEMIDMYDYSNNGPDAKRANFYRQARFMASYEDQFSYQGSFERYFPVYHDMRTEQLRGYFTWRSHVRRGQYEPTCASFVHVYAYELLNQIGVRDAMDGYGKLKELLANADIVCHDASLRVHLRQWLQEYCIYYTLDDTCLREQFAPEMALDHRYEILDGKADDGPEETFAAMSEMSSYHLASSIAVHRHPEEAPALFARLWRSLLACSRECRTDLFAECFGKRDCYGFVIFGNAVFYDHEDHAGLVRCVDGARIYRCDKRWTLECYRIREEKSRLFSSVMHEMDRLVRQCLEPSHPIKQKEVDAWIITCLQEEMKKYNEEKQDASRPRIEIDLARLSGIRCDAVVTRDRLLTEEEMRNEEETENAGEKALIRSDDRAAEARIPAVAPQEESCLTEEERSFLSSLLRQGDQEHAHLPAAGGTSPAILADRINEKLYDRVGDTVVEFCDGQPTIVEEYRSELAAVIETERK